MSKNKGGRPRKEIDIEQFEKLCGLQCTLHEIASWFDIHTDTLELRVKEHYGQGFSEIFKQKRGKGKIALRRYQMQAAERGNPSMLIWLGKQYLGQKDKQSLEHSGKITLEDLVLGKGKDMDIGEDEYPSQDEDTDDDNS